MEDIDRCASGAEASAVSVSLAGTVEVEQTVAQEPDPLPSVALAEVFELKNTDREAALESVHIVILPMCACLLGYFEPPAILCYV